MHVGDIQSNRGPGIQFFSSTETIWDHLPSPIIIGKVRFLLFSFS